VVGGGWYLLCAGLFGCQWSGGPVGGGLAALWGGSCCAGGLAARWWQCGSGGLPVLSVYCGLEKPSMG
jgi:hypothetical protein